MNAEILAVGTEILLGDIVNTNAQYIAQGLAELGIDVFYQTVVGDNPDRMKTAMNGRPGTNRGRPYKGNRSGIFRTKTYSG